ncbi:helix-turn-helix domain-containing protein [Solibacillus silvestris]
MTKDIGRKLKQLRKNQRMTQEDVADRVNITRSTISNYEIGRRTPHLKDLQKLANVFGVGLDYFGISAKDEAIDLLERAREVFNSPDVDKITKEELYREFMKLYLNMKGK